MPIPGFQHQRITFFADDDETPLLGAVDGSGNVTDPSFSTDPAHSRPYLIFQEQTGSAEINFAEGSSSIGQVNVIIGDKRQDPADQSTGIYTWLQVSGVTGTTQTLRRRVLWERLRADGITWETILNGILYHTSLNDDLVSYTLALRDIRERERAVRVFIKNNNAVQDGGGAVTVTEGTTVFPRVGPMEGWGHPTTYDDASGRVIFDPAQPFPTLSPVMGVKGTWYQDLLGGSYVLFDQADPANQMLIIDDKSRDLLAKYGQAALDGQDQLLLADGVFGPSYQTYDRYTYKNVIAQWATDPVGSAGWNTLRPMPGNSGPYFPFGKSVFDVQQVKPLKTWTPFSMFPTLSITAPDQTAASVNFVKSAKLIPSTGDASPTNGQVIYVRYISNLPPEEDVPKYIERASFGDLLEEIYDGVYSDPQVPPRVLYDQGAMDDMKTNTPPVLAIIKEVVTDMRGWVQENIYKPLGYAPALSPDGEVIPVAYALPDPSVSLLVLDDSNVLSASWEHGDENAVNKVSFTYQRDLVPIILGVLGTRIVEQDVVIEDWNVDSLALFNSKVLEYKPVTCHTVIALGGLFAQIPNVTNEVGWRLAMARSADVLMRFGSGAAECRVTVDATDPFIFDTMVGQWVVLQLSWLPEYSTRTRGCNRLMQISSIEKISPIAYEFLLVDAGPYTSAMVCPTVSGIAQDSSGRVTIDVTAIPANTIARLEFAVGDTEPPPNSGAWLLLQRLTAPATVTTSPQAPGTTVWIRWRGEQTARQPSAWCGPDSITIASVAQMLDVRLSISATGVPRVEWVGLSSTLGVKIKYQRHADGTLPPTVLSSDLDAAVDTNGSGSQGYTDLPITLDPLEQITIQLIGYPGWTGSAVSGTAGFASQFLTAQYIGVPIGPPTVLPNVVATGLAADVTLTVQSTSTTAKFTLQVKDDAGVIWDLVVSSVDATLLELDPGDVVPATAWFHQGSTFAQILNDVVLVAGVTRTWWAQATVVATPGVTSGWVAFTMQGEIDTSGPVSVDPVVMDDGTSADASTDFPNSVGMEDSDDGALTWDRSVSKRIKPVIDPSVMDIPAFPGPGGAMSVYQTVVKTTGSLADDASEVILLDIARTVAFQRIDTDISAWIRVYDTLAACLADVGRAIGTDAVPGSAGYPIFDTITDSPSSLVLPWIPNVVANNGDNPRIGRFYMRVTNISGSTDTVTTTIRYLPLEGDPSPAPPDTTGGGMIYRFNARTMTPVADGTETLSVPNTGSLGGTFDSSSSSSSGPKYKTNQINGNPTIFFTMIGGNTRPYGASVAPGSTPTEVHIFAVLKTTGGGAAWNGPGNQRTSFPNAAGNVSDYFCNTVERLVPISNNPTAAFMYHAHSSSSVWEAFVGLDQKFTTGTNTFSWPGVLIGGFFAGGFFTNIFEGHIGEIRIYTGPLTDDEVLGIKLQMSVDWGISL